MATHTHRGQCQVCSSYQAVSIKNGKLAKHGYTVAHGWFMGTCFGSHELPYEKSCDLIVESIERAKTIQNVQRQKLSEVLVNEGPMAWQRSTNWASRGVPYHWEEINLRESIERKYKRNLPWDEDFKKYVEKDFQYHLELYNKMRADHHRDTIRELSTYMNLQERRVREWVEKDLQEVKK